MNLTEEQRTRIQRTVLSRRNVPRVDNVHFSVSVGTAVPARVRIVEVPPTLVAIHPQWRGHRYFVVNDEIVIVDRSREIVAVVPVGSSGRGADLGRGGVALNLGPHEIRRVQTILVRKGFDIEVDGVLGPRTRHALVAFQRRQGFEATGHIDSRTATALGLSNMRGRQAGEGAGQSGTTGRGGAGAQQPSADQNRGASRQDNQGANQPSKMQHPAASQGAASGQRGNQGADQPSTTGQGGEKMRQPSAHEGAGGANNASSRPARAPQAGQEGNDSNGSK